MVAVAGELGLISKSKAAILKAISPEVEGLIDRTGTLRFGFDCAVIDPMPKVDPGFVTPWEQCSHESAFAIVKEGKPFAVYWSGGLDSTNVLCALMDVGVRSDQMTIVLTQASKSEYPLFYDRFIKGKFPERRVRPAVFSDVRYDELIVTGELGDQLFGSFWLNEYEELGKFDFALKAHWHEHVKHKYPAELQAEIIEMLEPFVAKAPFKIRTIFDYLWWSNFSNKWQHVAMRMASAMPNISAYLANIRTFYDTPAFQQWSMNEINHRLHKTGPTIDSYKLAARQYILSFTGDLDYAQFKKKLGSLPMKFAPRYMAVLESGERIQFGSFRCEEADLYVEKYGDRLNYLFDRSMACA